MIANDSVAIRDSLASLLNPTSGFQVVGLASDGLEVVKKARESLPDVVIMDAQMPNMDGVEATRHIKQTIPSDGILLISFFTDYLKAGIAAGAYGYLMKEGELKALFAELKRIATIATAAGSPPRRQMVVLESTIH